MMVKRLWECYGTIIIAAETATNLNLIWKQEGQRHAILWANVYHGIRQIKYEFSPNFQGRKFKN